MSLCSGDGRCLIQENNQWIKNDNYSCSLKCKSVKCCNRICEKQYPKIFLDYCDGYCFNCDRIYEKLSFKNESKYKLIDEEKEYKNYSVQNIYKLTVISRTD